MGVLLTKLVTHGTRCVSLLFYEIISVINLLVILITNLLENRSSFQVQLLQIHNSDLSSKSFLKLAYLKQINF